jgi:hypothetical protein
VEKITGAIDLIGKNRFAKNGVRKRPENVIKRFVRLGKMSQRAPRRKERIPARVIMTDRFMALSPRTKPEMGKRPEGRPQHGQPDAKAGEDQQGK